MFGYIRPFKSELLVRQWTYYQSAYCGLCKQIGRDYGALPRLALTYDLTFLAILLQCFAEDEADEQQDICLLNPVKRKTIMQQNRALEFSAAVTVLLAWYKGVDDKTDGHAVRGGAVTIALSSARKKAESRFPMLAQAIADSLRKLNVVEQGEPDPKAASACFGELLATVFKEGIKYQLAPRDSTIDAGVNNFNNADEQTVSVERRMIEETFTCLGDELGRWIYLLDAIDDYRADMDNKNWNPYSLLDENMAKAKADRALSALEADMDKTAMLLDFVRDSALIANVIRMGLPHVRLRILSGAALEKL
ncbi:MAG: hypothetical protein PWP10_3718 [Clostridiales bacterium]|jgi:hypothetical protein|nr:hypothetical protein [Clostridiales bacterium]